MNKTDLLSFIKESRIILDLKAASKGEVLSRLTQTLCSEGAISNEDGFLADVFAREEISNTAIGGGIAIPHGKSEFVLETSIAIGRIRDKIDWDTPDGRPIELVFLLAVNCNDKSKTHVRLLSQIAKKLANEKTAKKLIQASSAQELVAVFCREGENS